LFGLHESHGYVGLQLLDINLVVGETKLRSDPVDQVLKVLLVWEGRTASFEYALRRKRLIFGRHGEHPLVQ
jgi:hypothetical protein